jgi:hypothetical protein
MQEASVPKSKNTRPGKGDCKSWRAQDRAAGGCRWDWRRRPFGDEHESDAPTRALWLERASAVVASGQDDDESFRRASGSIKWIPGAHRLHFSTLTSTPRICSQEPFSRMRRIACTVTGRENLFSPDDEPAHGGCAFLLRIFRIRRTCFFVAFCGTRGWGMCNRVQSQPRPSNLRRPAVRQGGIPSPPEHRPDAPFKV